MSHIAILGSGGFGCSLAVMCAGCGHTVMLWSPFQPEVEQLRATREHTKLLPGIKLPRQIEITDDISGAAERYKNIGSLAFSYEVREGALYDSVELALSILDGLVRTPPAEEGMMKAGYVTNAKMLYDDPRDTNFTFAYDNHVMCAGYSSIEERAEVYKKITPRRISELADMIFRPENLTLTVKGRKKRIDTERLEGIIKGFRK